MNEGSTAVGFIDGMSEYEIRPYRENVGMGKAEIDTRLINGVARDKEERMCRMEAEEVSQSEVMAESKAEERKKVEVEERKVAGKEAKKLEDETKRAEAEAKEGKKAVTEKEERRRARAAEQRKKKGSPLGVFCEYI
jgi:hypothetical protein